MPEVAAKDVLKDINQQTLVQTPATAGTKSFQDGHVVGHPSLDTSPAFGSYLLMQPTYEQDYVESVSPKHLAPAKVSVYAAQLLPHHFFSVLSVNTWHQYMTSICNTTEHYSIHNAQLYSILMSCIVC
jgi:hypothetical protein